MRLPLALLGAVALLALPTAATAAVGATEVTAPADGTRFVVTDPAEDITIEGAAPGAADGDKVDLICRRGNESERVLAADVAVSGQEFSKAVSNHELPGGSCRVLAVADGTNLQTGDFSGYSGPSVVADWRRLFRTDPGIASPDLLIDFYELHSMPEAFGDFLSISSCGVCDTALSYADTGLTSNFVHYGNGYLDLSETQFNRAGARIDGHNAWGSYVAKLLIGGGKTGDDLEGVPPLTFTRTGGGPGEDMEMREEEDLVRCQNGDPFPVTEAGCGRWVPTGVRVFRRILQTRGGKLILVSDVFRSTDGAAHALDLHWAQFFRTPTSGAGPSFQFPWNGDAYATHVAGDTVPGTASAPAAMYMRTKATAPDGSRPFPQGLVMFDHPVGEIPFVQPDDFYVPTTLTVPAGGEVTLRQAYGLARTRGELAGFASVIEDQWVPPTLEITAPAEGATVNTAEIDVTGRATDNKSVPAVTLNGVAVPVGTDGTWSRRVTLQRGANTLTAVARDAEGQETTVARHVSFELPLPLPIAADTLVPVLSAVSLSRSRFRVAAGPTAVSAVAGRGTQVRYTLSEPSRVTFAISRARPGRRAGGKCRKPTRRNRSRARCRRYVKVGRTLTRNAPGGPSVLRFSGRIGSRALRRGRYRMGIRATDAAGNRSPARRLKFRIVRR